MKTEIIKILQKCYDPEIPIDLWNLGLIYDIKISDEFLKWKGCPELLLSS